MKNQAQNIADVPRSVAFRPATILVPWLACLAVALGVHHYLPMIVDEYWVNVFRRVGVFVMAAVSLNVVNGFAGQFSMGHAGFMAIGAYVAAGFSYYGSLYFRGEANVDDFMIQGTLLMLVGIVAGAFAAAGAGYLVGLPSLRLRGDYLAIVTLGFGEIIRVTLELTGKQVYDAKAFQDAPLSTLATLPFNGSTGFERVQPYANLFWVWLLVGVVCVVAYRIKNSSVGLAFLSILEDELAARSMGIDLTKYKVRAFVLAAFLGGVAGAIYAHAVANPSPTDAGFQRSFDIIIFVVLGGLGSLSGTAIAATLLTVLSEVLRGPESIVNSPAGVWSLAGIALALAVGSALLKAVGNRGWRVLAVASVAPVLLVCFAYLAQWLATAWGVKLSDYRMILYALLLIMVMLLRPNGLLGVR
ncbi:MAG: branched-chain amino acid ABC transporter permease, partial [Phycisphaerales bacterium]